MTHGPGENRVTPSPRPALTRPILAGVAIGTAYGIAARLLAEGGYGVVFGAMTWSFLFLVPLCMGFLTVRPHPAPSWTFRLLAPWVPITLSVLVAWVTGWEGAICIVMGMPILLILGSTGGVLAAMVGRRAGVPVAALLPFLLAPLEARLPLPTSLRRVESTIVIATAADRVWAEIIAVPTITPGEQRAALFTRIGFPRPVSATLSHQGVGGVRMARFEGGVLFVETIADWEPDRLLRFTIRPETDSIPVTTLDRHVVVGGRYFDVLTGTYRIEPWAGGGVALRLTSELRVSTPFNFYAGPWADAIMQSIQANILAVLRDRAERATPAASR